MDDQLRFWNRIFQTSKLRKSLYDHPSRLRSLSIAPTIVTSLHQASAHLELLGTWRNGRSPWAKREALDDWMGSIGESSGSIGYSITKCLPCLVNIQKAIEHGHWNSGFSHKTWWFSIVMLVYQRVIIQISWTLLEVAMSPSEFFRCEGDAGHFVGIRTWFLRFFQVILGNGWAIPTPEVKIFGKWKPFKA